MYTTQDGSMQTTTEAVIHAAEPTDRRPDFCAETLSPAVRVLLLVATLIAVAMLFTVVGVAAAPEGTFEVSSFAAVFTVGMLVGLTFFVFLVFGALLGNNPRLSTGERVLWYTLFAIAGPVALPAYWLLHVYPVPYAPTYVQKL